MDIVFGWDLDRPTFPETADGAAFSVDSAVVGPLKILDLLETRLGVNGPDALAALRIAQYSARLRAIDDGGRFFSRSREADEWATARLVLYWRDELVAAGWSPQAASWRSPRLEALALAEAQDELPLAPGVPDRARAVADRIAKPGPVATLKLADAPERLPFVWRRLIDVLAEAGAEVLRVDARPCAQANDLARVQAALSGATPRPLANDGSFSVVRADNELVAAEIAAEWLAARDDNEGVAIVRQGDGTILDAACRRLGLPQPGGSDESPFRGALQVLPLAFETAWEPLDAARLLELLVMPRSPIPARAGRHFAKALRDCPGSGDRDWRSAWEKAEAEHRARLAEAAGGDDAETAKAEIERKVERDLARWRQWLEPQRFRRADGIAASAARAICGNAEAWATRRARGANDTSYMRAAGTAAALARTISASGLDPIPKPQLDRMIDAVVADGDNRPDGAAEAAGWTTIGSSAQVWDAVPAILWWGFSDPGWTRSREPWTAEERAELEAARTVLPAPEDRVALHLAAQRRAILNARERALLVMPAMSAGVESATHPIWHELAGLDGRDRVTIDGRELRLADRISLCGREWKPTPVERRDLPEARRDWNVGKDLIGPREYESATSLQTLLGCPMSWVLQYRAGIHESVFLDMADGNRLKGNIAHEVLARLLTDEPLPAQEAKIRAAVDRLLDEALPAIGSTFLLPGRSSDRDDLRRNTAGSAVRLLDLLRRSGLTVTATERRSEVRIDDRTTLSGIIDLEAETADGRPAIVDLKWSNSDRYRREEIEAARPIQLATYARLLKDGDNPAFAPAAYFMLKQSRLLAVDADPFPPESRIAGSDLEDVWNAIVAARKRLLGELAEGRVTATGVPPNAPEAGAASGDGDTLAIEPPCRFCPYGRLCGKKPSR